MPNSSLFQALSIINSVILRRTDINTFEAVYANQDWFYAFEPSAKGQDIIRFSDNSAFLQDFFFEAEPFWQQRQDNVLKSGIWSEQTAAGLLRLEAIAACSDSNDYLVISNVQHEFERQRDTLQVARELLLSNDEIQAQHEYMHERLDHLLKENQNLQDSQQPIREAIENADFGVCVLDDELNAIQANPALLQMLDLDRNSDIQKPVEILKALFEKQYPEYERHINTAANWSGELYWLKPPVMSKWLQFDVYPVFDQQHKVKQWLWLITDISRVKYLMQTNEQLHLCDVLTGLPNRQSFWQHLNQIIEQKQPFYLLQLNILGFKRVNELYGHLAGDEILCQLVKRLQKILGSQHFLARVGGNEFAIVLCNTSSREACQEIVERMFLEAGNTYVIDNQKKCHVELSAGATLYPNDTVNPEELIKLADLAAFESKAKRKSQLVFFSQELKDKSLHFTKTEAALREAIEASQFEIHLQPIMDLHSDKIVKAEALIRWNRPEHGLVMPNDFIPVAEQTGLIVPIGKWVISQALVLLNLLQKSGSNVKIAVNLSPQQVNDVHLLEYIRNSINSSKADARHLEIELTEGVFVENFDRAHALLEAVRELGVSVSIDDFGTGYSSLAYLQKLPIDHLKIDRSFVNELDTNENDRAIVSAVIAMAHSLKLGVIAEGVENTNQCDFLREQHCASAQGYLFSKPVSFDNFCSLLELEKKTEKLV